MNLQQLCGLSYQLFNFVEFFYFKSAPLKRQVKTFDKDYFLNTHMDVKNEVESLHHAETASLEVIQTETNR